VEYINCNHFVQSQLKINCKKLEGAAPWNAFASTAAFTQQYEVSTNWEDKMLEQKLQASLTVCYFKSECGTGELLVLSSDGRHMLLNIQPLLHWLAKSNYTNNNYATWHCNLQLQHLTASNSWQLLHYDFATAKPHLGKWCMAHTAHVKTYKVAVWQLVFTWIWIKWNVVFQTNTSEVQIQLSLLKIGALQMTILIFTVYLLDTV